MVVLCLAFFLGEASMLVGIVAELIRAPHQQCVRVPFSVHHTSIWYVFLMAILTRVRWKLDVLYPYISMMTKQVEHFLRCLLAYFENKLPLHLING